MSSPLSRIAALGGFGAKARARSGISVIPGILPRPPWQDRARFFTKNVGWVRRSFKFTAYQCSRSILSPQYTEDGVNYETVDVKDDRLVWAALRLIRGRRLTQAELIERMVYLDDTLGEWSLVTTYDDETGRPYWTVRDPVAVRQQRAGNMAWRFEVMELPGGTPSQGTSFYVHPDSVYRHWHPDSDYELMPDSSLNGVINDLEVLWDLERGLSRKARSRLAMNDVLWTPAEAHLKMVRHKNKDVSELELAYAQAAAARLKDTDDREVASVAPMMIKTPGSGQLGKPEILKMPGIDAELLQAIAERRMIIADSLPLSSSSILQGVELKPNHWSEWKAREDDQEVMDERLTRNLKSLDEGAFIPLLERMVDAGIWRGNPERWKIGADMGPIISRPDNSENADKAFSNFAIGYEAYRRDLHYTEADAPTTAELAIMKDLAIAKAGPSPTQISVGQGTNEQGAIGPPNKGIAPGPADEETDPVTAALNDLGPLPLPAELAAPPVPLALESGPKVIDDRWLLQTTQ